MQDIVKMEPNMCIICIEMDKSSLSPWEAKRNLKEMVEKIGQDHAIEVENKISEAIYDEINFQFGQTLHQAQNPDDTLDEDFFDHYWKD